MISIDYYSPLLLASLDLHQPLKTLPAGQPRPPPAIKNPSYWLASISISQYSPRQFPRYHPTGLTSPPRIVQKLFLTKSGY